MSTRPSVSSTIEPGVNGDWCRSAIHVGRVPGPPPWTMGGSVEGSGKPVGSAAAGTAVAAQRTITNEASWTGRALIGAVWRAGDWIEVRQAGRGVEAPASQRLV